jgi:hypothetical protein
MARKRGVVPSRRRLQPVPELTPSASSVEALLKLVNPTGAPIRSLTVEAGVFRVELYEPPAGRAPVETNGTTTTTAPEAWDVPHAGAQPYESKLHEPEGDA